MDVIDLDLQGLAIVSTSETAFNLALARPAKGCYTSQTCSCFFSIRTILGTILAVAQLLSKICVLLRHTDAQRNRRKQGNLQNLLIFFGLWKNLADIWFLPFPGSVTWTAVNQSWGVTRGDCFTATKLQHKSFSFNDSSPLHCLLNKDGGAETSQGSAVDKPKFMRRLPDHPWWKTGLPESFLDCPNWQICTIIIPTTQQSWSGVYWFHLVCLSVHLSACGQNGVRSVSSTMLDPFHIYTSHQAT